MPAFLSLLTERAISSTYVLFELGARWGCGKPHIPLLARGAGVEALKEPLKAKNALQMSEEAAVLQLVQDVAHFLNLQAEPPNSYLKKVRKVVEVSSVQVAAALPRVASRREIEHLAKARLIQCVDLLKNIPDFNQALNLIRHIQKSWNPEQEQVSVVVNDKCVLHSELPTPNSPAAACWEDEMSGGQSLYLPMKTERRGLKIARIRGQEKRLTAIAFETMDNPACMVIAEAHDHKDV